MAINQDIINPDTNWENQTKGYVEDGLKTLLRAMLDVLENPTVASNSVGREQLTQAIRDAIDSIAGKVPNTRTVNGKALSQNITLNSSDVGAMPADAPVVKGVAVGENNPVTPDSNGIVTLPEGGSSQEPDPAMSDTSENAVQNKVIKAYVDNLIASLQNALDTLIGSGNVQGAIDTFNEVVAFLNGIDTDDPTLANHLLALTTAIDGKQATISDLASIRSGAAAGATAVQPSAMTEAIEEAVEDLNIPSKTSDLTNDDGFITAQEVSDIVAASGDIAIVETSDYIDIFIYQSEIQTSPTAIVLDGEDASHKSATLTINGSHLKDDIVVSVPTGFYIGATGTATSATLQQSGGSVTNQQVVIRHNGQNEDTDITGVNISLVSGSYTKNVPLSYTRYAGPTIIADDSDITIKAAEDSSESADLLVQGARLEGDITATITGGNGKFKVSANGSTPGSSATIAESDGTASGTLTISYEPASGDTGGTATLTLSTPSGNSTKTMTINLIGSLAAELSINPASASIGIASGGSGTATFHVQGAHLTPSATIGISVNGNGMSVSPSTLSADANGEVDDDVVVTFSGSADSNGTLAAACQTDDVSASSSVVGSIVTPLPANASFKVDGIHYKVNADQQSVRVWNGSSESGAASTKYSGAITIPASVSDSGVTANLDGGGTQVGAGATYAVTQLASYAFGGCTNLTSLTLPEGLRKISNAAIRECKNSSFKTLVIPSTVNFIGTIFLWDCTYLETVEMRCYNNPNWDSNNTDWGGNNSGNCNKLTHLLGFVIPDGFTGYKGTGDYGNFKGCTALETITLGKGLSYFYDLFSQITGVTKIYCRSTTPPKINPTTDSTYSIPASVYANAQVYVPRGYLQAYLDAYDGRQVNGANVYMWKNFNDNHALIEYDPE